MKHKPTSSKPAPSDLKRKQIDYRILVLRNLFKVFKLCKSFIQQKIATKLKKFSFLLKSDPKNEKFLKSFKKFEKKIQVIKSLKSKDVKAAAFTFARFDLKLNFDPITGVISEMLEQDSEVLVAEIFAQFENEETEKQNYLIFYQHIKEKPQKRFTEAKEQALKLITQVKEKKEAKIIRKRKQISNKKDRKETGSQEISAPISEDDNDEDSHQNSDKEISESDGNSLETGPLEPSDSALHKQLVSGIDKILQKNTFFPRNREKPKEVKSIAKKVFPVKNDRNKRTQIKITKKIVPVLKNKEDDYHPSYLSKINVRKEQKEKKYEGEVVDL